MKSTLDRLEGLSRKLNVEIPAAKVQEAFEKVYKAIQKKANIKGFRQGKAPISTIKSMYSEQVKSDVLNELVNEGYQHALDEHGLEPVGYPKVSFQPLDEDKDLSFTAEFEIRPEVDVKKFEGLPVVREKLEIPEDRINEILENIRSGHAESVTVFEDRALGEGDVAVLDFVGKVNGQPLPNGSAQGHELEIGAKQFIEGFEDGLVGMKIGEQRTLNLRFPEGYHEASLSGAPVEFDVKLGGIKKKVLPELNDELAKKLGGDFNSLDDLKTRIRKDLEDGEKRRIQEEMRNRIVKSLVEANPVEAPRSLVLQQKEALIEDFKGKLKQQGLNEGEFEEYRKKWDKDFEESATFMVKSTFLLDALAEKLQLRAKPDEIGAKIEEYAQQTGIELPRIKEFYNRPERRSRLMFQITEEKVVNHLIEKASVKEVPKDQLPQEASAVGLYSDVIFPKFYDCVCKHKYLDERRSSVVKNARGRVLEIGIGTGLNLDHYPADVRELWAIDPNPGMERQLKAKVASRDLKLHFERVGAESLPFESGFFDTVVSTLVMCSIPELQRALGEVRRVLKPSGRLLFLEHGLSPDPWVRRTQYLLNPVQGLVGAGCKLTVNAEAELLEAGFALPKLSKYYIKNGPKFLAHVYDGLALPPNAPPTSRN